MSLTKTLVTLKFYDKYEENEYSLYYKLHDSAWKLQINQKF